MKEEKEIYAPVKHYIIVHNSGLEACIIESTALARLFVLKQCAYLFPAQTVERSGIVPIAKVTELLRKHIQMLSLSFISLFIKFKCKAK